jgi:hypothetical protein
MRARLLQTECRLIAVTDQSEPTNMAGASRAASDWQRAGRSVDHIAFPISRKASAGRPRGASSFRPVVFLWDLGGTRADLAVLKKAQKRKDSGLSPREFFIVPRTSRVGGEGTAIVAPSLDAALRFADACAGDEAVRVICDFGPALGGDLKPDPRLIARLSAGSDLPGFPGGRPLSTLHFAAQAVAELGEAIEVRPVGRAEEATRAGEEARARRRAGLPVYRLSSVAGPAKVSGTGAK